MHDLHPPQEVVAAYHDVARAMEARERRINEAAGQALSKKRQSEAQSELIIRQAAAAKHEKIDQAEAAGVVFAQKLAARNGLSHSQELRLGGDPSTSPSAGPVADYE